MITNEQVTGYLRTLEHQNDDLLELIEMEAIRNNIPIIKKEVQGLLRVLLSIIKPIRILEIGTAVGYSSILMSNHLPYDGHIVTIERSQAMIQQAKININKSNKTSQITIIEGDAIQQLESITESFDMIFMDAAKGQYLSFLPHCIRLLKDEGVLISDNVLQEGMVAKSRYSIPRRQRTIHSRMREYLYTINNHPNLETVVLPISDGITISYKKAN